MAPNKEARETLLGTVLLGLSASDLNKPFAFGQDGLLASSVTQDPVYTGLELEDSVWA